MMIALVGLAGTMPAQGGAPPENKSLGKALLFSLALPGAGEAYLGATGRARVFMMSEAAIWSSFAYFQVQGGMREDAYKDQARLFAGVEPGKSLEFYKILAYYLSSEEYNIDVKRQARLLYPDDLGQQAAYVEANGYFGDDGWQWDSLERMEEFARERTLSRHSYRRAVLTTGFAVLNRMVSMIDVYLSFRLEDKAHGRPRLSLSAGPTSSQEFRLYISAPF
jgi:hypothetical protein